MKKNHLKLIIAALAISSSLTIYSCSTDDDEIATIIPVGIAQDPNNFKGDVTNGQVVTLDATKVYVLNGSIRVKDGGKLVIPAGTRIVATAAAASYIIVEQGGQLYANGTAASPVLFTSSQTAGGSWGGIVICGKAPINTGTTGSSEIGNTTYGGTSATDNSGSLTYVRIEYAGADFVTNKKFNGLSLFGVGSDTVVENIALLNGAEDGIQLYGGTVNVSNIVSIGNDDDAFGWTDGWIGTGTNIYTKRKTNGTGNIAISGINNTTNPDASPRSNPTIKNVTVLGGTSGTSDAIKLAAGTYASFENVVFSNWATGFNLDSSSTIIHFNGESKIKDVFFDTNVTTKITATGTTISADTYTEKADATGAGNAALTPTWATVWSGLQ